MLKYMYNVHMKFKKEIIIDLPLKNAGKLNDN